VIIGSRNIKGGSVEGWGALRNIISKGGSLYSRIVLGCPIKDLTGGFNMWTKSALEKINLQSVISRGYSFQIEMKYRAYKAGCSIIEIPIVFPDRQAGKSKMSKKIFIEAMLTQWKLRKAVKSKDTRSGFGEFWRFAITGGLGTISNLAIFFVCADLFNMPETPVSVGCFLITATQNYIINHKWSFKFKTASQPVSLKKWLQFIATSLFGLLVNIIVMRSILSHYTLPFKFIAQGCGIAAGMLINFAFSKFIVFRKHRN
jgi:putative flippase GtrA